MRSGRQGLLLCTCVVALPDRRFIKSYIVSLSCSCRLSRSIFSGIHAMATGEHCLVIFVDLLHTLENYVYIMMFVPRFLLELHTRKCEK